MIQLEGEFMINDMKNSRKWLWWLIVDIFRIVMLVKKMGNGICSANSAWEVPNLPNNNYKNL